MATVITNLLSAIPYLGQDLVVSIYNLLLVPIGILSPHALKNKKEVNLSKISIPFLSIFVGFIDGDGYLSITKSKKGFLTIKFVISLHRNDLSTLEYFQSILKLGKIYIYEKTNTCVLVINRTDLQKYIFPLLMYHKIFFLTENRTKQFNKILYIFKNNLLYYKDIPNNIPNEISIKDY